MTSPVKTPRKLLVVTEKWCDGNPAVGLSNTLHNVHGSLELSGTEYDSLFYDEIHREGGHIDKVLAEKDPADYLAIIILPMFQMPFNPSTEAVKSLKER